MGNTPKCLQHKVSGINNEKHKHITETHSSSLNLAIYTDCPASPLCHSSAPFNKRRKSRFFADYHRRIYKRVNKRRRTLFMDGALSRANDLRKTFCVKLDKHHCSVFWMLTFTIILAGQRKVSASALSVGFRVFWAISIVSQACVDCWVQSSL